MQRNESLDLAFWMLFSYVLSGQMGYDNMDTGQLLHDGVILLWSVEYQKSQVHSYSITQ